MSFLAVINNAVCGIIQKLLAPWVSASSQITLLCDGKSILKRRMMKESGGPVLSVWPYSGAQPLSPMRYVLIYSSFA